MPRYYVKTSKPKQRIDVYDDYSSVTYDVVVNEAGSVKTGLIDQDGRDIMRSSNPVGFTAKIE